MRMRFETSLAALIDVSNVEERSRHIKRCGRTARNDPGTCNLSKRRGSERRDAGGLASIVNRSDFSKHPR
jgi:hypothetical protein